MNPLLLAVDVGNTATSFGLFPLTASPRSIRPLKVRTVATPLLAGVSGATAALRAVRRSFRGRVEGAIVSSVVPSVDAPLRRAIKTAFGRAPVFVTAKASRVIKVRTRVPSEVGADRIVNARAARALHPGASIVVDFGTATTFDCVTSKGEYLGGVIAPGPVISAEALYRRTAKLPMVLLKKPVRALGRDTLQSIQAGLYHGYRGLVKEILGQLKKVMGARTKVFVTGGQAQWILKGVPGVDAYRPDLTLVGLCWMWRDLRRAGHQNSH